MIFKELDTGKHYRTYYSVGSTEYQDEEPFEYEDEMECTEVAPVEVTVVRYEPVTKEESNR